METRVKQTKLYLTPSEHTKSEKSDDSGSSDYEWWTFANGLQKQQTIATADS